MILKSRRIFLQEKYTDVIPKILMGTDLQEEIRADYDYNLIKGPFPIKG
jgi:hypothetical protein